MSGTLAKRSASIAAVAALMLASLTAAAVAAAPGRAGAGAVACDATAEVVWNVVESTPDHTLVEVLVPEPVSRPVELGGRLFDALTIPGAAPLGTPGEPLLAVAATFIAVPPASAVSLSIVDEEAETREGLKLAPAQDDAPDAPFAFDRSAYAIDRLSPEAAASIGEPAILRDFRVVALRVYPVRYNPATGRARLTRRLVVRLDYSAGGAANVLNDARPASRRYEALYRDLIANYDQVRPRYEDDESGRYLIITHDSYYESILPLAEWKHKSGMEVEIAKLSVIGSSYSAIKTYIQDAYDTWDTPPDYVLLVGDTEYLPDGPGGDDYYAKLSGTDYLVDVDLGRFSCDSVAQCDLLVAKTLGYERTPVMEDTSWYRKACLIVRNDYDEADIDYFADTWHAYDLLTMSGYTEIDTLFSRNGSDYNDVHAAVTDGRTILNYRGQGVLNWWSPFDCDPNSTNPGYKLPLVVSATCGSGSYDSDGYPCETWMRAGSVASPKGCVAFLGTSVVASHVSQYRSAVDQGIFTALFVERLYTVTAALNYGKLRFYQLYADQTEYQGWNTQGDPALDVWTRPPRTLSVTHPTSVPAGPSDLVVAVETGGNPLSKARVCAHLPGEIYSVGLTNTAGQVTLSIDPAAADTIMLTVTAHNAYPYEAAVPVVPEGPYLSYHGQTLDDSSVGNDDGLLSPGETVDCAVELENVGPDSAYAVTAVLRSVDPYVSVSDSTASYGDIAAGGSAGNAQPYRFTLTPDCPNGHEVVLSLRASASETLFWNVCVQPVTASAADLAHEATSIDDGGPRGDGDGVLEPGETAWIVTTLRDDGPIGLDEVVGVLSTSDPYVAVTDASGGYGTVAGDGGTGSCSGNAYRVSVSPTAPPGHEVAFSIAASGEADTYTHAQDVDFAVTLGGSATAGPCGPDAYGYYAYDTEDVWTGQAPTYDWVEIAGVGTKIAAITDADAATTTITLPFTFRYYGTDYTQVSVCSNGFLAMGTEDYRLGDNSSIPNPLGPSSMIAPFWDDLNPDENLFGGGGDIYQWSDTAGHRYVVQFDQCEHYMAENPETFEVILYDPAYYPTTTGDGVILFQYQDVRSISGATVGVENDPQTTGVQYLYNASYDPCAAVIGNGAAIRFTTEAPAQSAVWLVADGTAIDDSSGGNGDATPQPGETFDLIVTLANRGADSAPSVTASLSTSDSDVTVVDGTSPYGTIPAGGDADNAASPFRLAVASEPSDDSVELDLEVSTGERYDTWDVITLVLDLSQSGVDDGSLPLAFAARQNFPNPFRTGTSIAFGLPRPCRARVDVYDVAGRRVATLLDRDLPAGWHAAPWDGRDAAGVPVSAGVYFYRITAGGKTLSKKMTVLK